jgi:phosphoribosylformylglycinamidine synthase
MKDVIKFANNGGIVIGICNGFQILLESKLLDGGLKLNSNLSFTSKMAYIKIENNDNVFLNALDKGSVYNIPIANHDGNFYINKQGLNKLKNKNCIIFKYCNKNGNDKDINGSCENIAGICNENKNVFGLMPHPERAVDNILGSNDGFVMIKSLLNNLL